MYASAYDANRLVLVALQSKGVASNADFEANVLDVERFCEEAVRRPNEVASVIAIVESDNPPTALHRKRLAASENRIPNLNLALVGTGIALRFFMTVNHWLAPNRPGFARSVHATFELARDWHVSRGPHTPIVFDLLHYTTQRRLRDTGRSLSARPRPAIGRFPA
jgi:hypothetical protein